MEMILKELKLKMLMNAVSIVQLKKILVHTMFGINSCTIPDTG